MDFEKMANTIVIHWRETRPRDSAEADAQLCTAIATALRAAATVPPKMVRVGVEDHPMKDPLELTADGVYARSCRGLWCWRGVVGKDAVLLQGISTDSWPISCCYSTESAARDAKGGG